MGDICPDGECGPVAVAGLRPVRGRRFCRAARGGDGASDEAAYGEADAAADSYADTDPGDPYAADPYGTALPQSIGDRSVADVATSVLGIKGAQRVQDAETIVRTVIGKAGGNGGPPGSVGADPVGLVQDILTAARKTKDPQ